MFVPSGQYGQLLVSERTVRRFKKVKSSVQNRARRGADPVLRATREPLSGLL